MFDSEFDGESFESFINDMPFFDVLNLGPLYGPLSKIEIKREDDLRIILTTTSSFESTSNRRDCLPGTVRINDEKIEISHPSGSEIIMDGVTSHGRTIKHESNGGVSIEKSSVHSVSANIQDESLADYLIEWVENIEDGYFIWPGMINRSSHASKDICLEDGIDTITLKSRADHNRSSMGFISTNLGGCHVYICRNSEKGDKKGKGFILYRSILSDKERTKIRDCISFAIGRYIVYKGFSTYCKNDSLVSFKAVSGYSMDGLAFKHPSYPPAPLSSSNIVDRHIFSRVTEAFYSKYDAYDMIHCLWIYWHAVFSPIHMAATGFGSAIEALKEAHIKASAGKFSAAIIEKDKFKDFREKICTHIKEMDVSEFEKRIITEKLSELNKLPMSLLIGNLYDSLFIKIGETETKAWKARNGSAHGTSIMDDDSEIISNIRDVKALRVMFNRLYVSITAASDYYIDYYSYNHPNRPIEESVP